MIETEGPIAMPFEQAPPDASNIIPGCAPAFPSPVDAVELLPPSRRPLLLDLKQRRDDAANTLHPLIDQLAELRADKHRLEARVKQLRMARGAGGPGLGDDDIQVVDIRRKLASADSEIARLSELIEVRRSRAGSIAALVAKLESWLRDGRPSGTVVVEAKEIDARFVPKRGETVTSALDRLRHRLRELDADRHRIESAPLPSALAKTKMRGEIAQLAERGAPDLGTLVEVGHAIGWPTSRQNLGLAAVVATSGDQVVGSAMDETTDAMALVVWLHRDALVARLEAEIDVIADDKAALSPENRERKLAEIAQDRVATERQEAALVWSMQGDGLAIEHRTDADPRAVLAIETVVAHSASNGSGPRGMAARAVQTIEVPGR